MNKIISINLLSKSTTKREWHITTATHNSRYSQHEFDNFSKSGKPVWLSEREEQIITETIVSIAEKDKLNILAYNICGDHMHILLVCEAEKVPGIIGKMKSMSARACNIGMGRTVPSDAASAATMGHAPLSEGNGSSRTGHAPLSGENCFSETGHAPLSDGNDSSAPSSGRGNTQTKLWTQKFGCKKITSERQLNNTIKYIQKNRQKHQLPENKILQHLIQKITTAK